MGMYDSFYDEDSKCPKCHKKVKDGWETRRLRSFLERWNKGDFFQYKKVINNPDWKPSPGLSGLAGVLKKLDEPIENRPIMDNGKVPVHTDCESCDARLEAYAKIVNGRFAGIVEVEADGDPKELFVIKPETTAKMLKEELQRKMSHLQESCSHENTRWDYGTGRVCLRCEKTLETAEESGINPNDPIFRIGLGRRKAKNWGKGTEAASVNHDKILYGPEPKPPLNKRKMVRPGRKQRRRPGKTRK